MKTLFDKIRSAKGRNQARMVIKEHCNKLGINYKDYELTKEESAAYFCKAPSTPFKRRMGELDVIKSKMQYIDKS